MFQEHCRQTQSHNDTHNFFFGHSSISLQLHLISHSGLSIHKGLQILIILNNLRASEMMDIDISN